MKFLILLIGLVLVSGCLEKEIETKETVEEETCPKDKPTSLIITTREIEGCQSMNTIYHKVNKTEFNFTLPYQLWHKFDNCGLNQLVYYIPKGKMTHIYDKEGYLIGGFKSKECVEITEVYDNIIFGCEDYTEQKIFLNLTEDL